MDNEQKIPYICAICGKESLIAPGQEIVCQHNQQHKAMLKKRQERPIVYKCY